MSDNFIVSPYAISFDSIKNNLQNYVLQKAEGKAWKDFYVSSTGETVIEIILTSIIGILFAFK